MLAPSRHQVEVMLKCHENQSIKSLMAVLDRTDRTKFRHQVLTPLLDAGLVEMTIPDKPRSSLQRYRLTEAGWHFVALHYKNSTRTGSVKRPKTVSDS
jgi:hypothetical protein